MKIYIAGKITNDSDYKIKFSGAQKFYEDQGYIVLNPAILPSNMNQEDYTKICLAMIDVADVVSFLPDYEESPGAMLEFNYCNYVGKDKRLYKNDYLVAHFLDQNKKIEK